MPWLIDARPLIDRRRGGVSRVSRQLVHALVKQTSPSELIFVTTGMHPPSSDAFPAGVRTYHVRLPNKLWSLICFLGLTSLDRVVERRMGKIDGVLLFNVGFTGRLKRPYALLLHDLSFLIEPRWFSRRTRWWHPAVRAIKVIQNASHLFSVSERTKQDAVRLLKIPTDRITVIPMGETLSPSRPTLSPSVIPAKAGTHRILGPVFQRDDRRRTILALGGGDARKNIALAIEVVKKLREDSRYQDVHLTIVGPQRMISPPSWITVLPSVTDDKLIDLYQQTTVFVYPSWYEGYGLPLHEAATFGTPCLTSTAGALPETAPNGTRFADPTKPHQWIEILRDMIDHPEQHGTSMDEGTKENWDKAAEIIWNKR